MKGNKERDERTGNMWQNETFESVILNPGYVGPGKQVG